MKEKIGIVGAGLIGRAWAIVFARAGLTVAIHDAAPDALAACQALLHENLGDLAHHGLLSEPVDTVLARITPVANLGDALQGAVLVQENVGESVEAKRAIFAELDRLADAETILASSTSWVPASSFSANLPGRGRIMVAHPVNPPYLVPLVELAPAPWTRPDIVERARDLYAKVGQSPVLLKKEITGFLLNRIQGAVLNEALNLYAGGYASMDDIDKVMTDGLGMRWSFMGPFETIDLNAPGGVTDYADRYGTTYSQIARANAGNDWNPPLIERVNAERRAKLPAAKISERSRWRDNRLMALVTHRRNQAP